VPEIVVILPTYNGARHVEASVRSVLAQQGCDFELVVCDDGSSDDTPQRVRDLADARTQLMSNERNRGLFPTLNRLIRGTEAPLIRLWSQDDIMLPGCLARDVAYGRAHPDVAMWWCAVSLIDDAGAHVAHHQQDDTPEVIGPELAARMMYYHGSVPGNIANVALRRSALERSGLFHEDLAVSGDFEMWVRLSEHDDIGRIATPGVQLRRHAGQFSRHPASALKFMRENEDIYARLIARLSPTERQRALRHRATVLDPMVVHHAARCLAQGQVRVARQSLATLGSWTAIASASFYWSRSLPPRLLRRIGVGEEQP
jgi:glycosyltransferase involved in cell wall biosynthesis